MKNFKKLLFIALTGVSVLSVKSSEVSACNAQLRAELQAQQEAERQLRETLKMNNIKNMINEKKDIFLEKMEGFINVSVNRGLDGLEQKVDTINARVQTIDVFSKNISNINGRINSIDQKVDHLEQRLDLILSKVLNILEYCGDSQLY